MNILFICTRCPYPPYEGLTLRTYNILKWITNNHKVYLFTFIQGENELGGIPFLRNMCTEVKAFRLPVTISKLKLILALLCNLFFSNKPFIATKYDTIEMRQAIRNLLGKAKIHVAHLDLLPLSQYVNELEGIPKILVEHNVENILLKRRSEKERNIIAKLYLHIQWLRVKKYEGQACRKVDRVVTVSELDKKELLAMSANTAISCVPNGVDPGYFKFSEDHVDHNGLVFVGSLSWFPNLDGIQFFTEQIFPIILNEIPYAKLTVIGKKTNRTIKLKHADHIIMTGFVEDIRPIVSKAAVYIVPLRVGGGTRLKILDALSMGKAVVSTSIGCEGLEVTHSKNIVIADKPEEFARETINLMRHPELAVRIGQEGRNLVETKYDWKIIAKKMNRVYESLYKPEFRRGI